jgi:hypothetical protein
MIVSNNSRMLGLGRYAVVKNKTFALGISLAPEGVFRGYSILLAAFDPNIEWQTAYQNGQLIPLVKFILHPNLTKAGRTAIFDLVVERLGTEEAETFGFVPIIALLLERGKANNIIIDSVIHPDLQKELNQESLLLAFKEAKEQPTAEVLERTGQ